ncbi:hypothetical protein Tco_0053310 [Tanacetum coccineum]
MAEEDPSIHGVKEGGIIKDGLGGDSGPVSNVPSFAKIVQDKLVKKKRLWRESISSFANSLYWDISLAKILVFLLVENYRFDFKEGLWTSMMEHGPCSFVLSTYDVESFGSKHRLMKVEIVRRLYWGIETTSCAHRGIFRSMRKGHTLATVVDIDVCVRLRHVCSTCLIFDHVDDKCPKRPKVDAPTKDTDDGFVEVMEMKESSLLDGLELVLIQHVIGASSHADKDWSSNGSSCSKGTRIILGWNHNEVDVAVINLNDQYRPWCILGDFNSTLFLEDSTSSSSSFNISMREFKECVEEIKVRDVQRSGSIVWMLKSSMLLSRDKATVVVAFIDALIMEERFLKQKAKIDWLREGDSNSAYFHKVVKSRISRSRIDVVTYADGTTVDNEKVADAFVSHYEQFLGLPGITSPFDTTDLFSTRLTDDHARDMICVIRILKGGACWLRIPCSYDWLDYGVCTTTSFSISISGSLHGFFKGKRGLRQDNLFLFAHGDVDSAIMIKDALKEFKNV